MSMCFFQKANSIIFIKCTEDFDNEQGHFAMYICIYVQLCTDNKFPMYSNIYVQYNNCIYSNIYLQLNNFMYFNTMCNLIIVHSNV